MNNSLGQTLVKNTFWLFIGEVISRLLKFFLVLYAARILGVAGWGIFAYAISVVSLFFIFADLGLDRLIIREISKDSLEKMRYLSTAFFFRLILLIIATCFILIIVPHISNVTEGRGILLITAIFLGFDSLRGFFLTIYRALEQMEKEAFVKLFTNILIVILGFIVLFTFPSVENFAYAYLGGSLAGLIVTFFAMRKYFSSLISNFSASLIGQIWRITWPFFIFGITGAVMTYTDMIMLGWWKTPIDLGLYSVAQRLLQFLLIIPSYLAMATFPLFSRLIEEDEGKLKIIFEKILSLVILLGFPMVFGGILLGKDIILIVFGESYMASTLVFQIFLAGLIIAFPMLIISNYVFAKNIQRKFVPAAIGSMFLNVILSIFFIPRFGIYGAAVATVTSSSIFNIIIYSIVQKISHFEIFSHIKKVVLATIIMSLITFWAKYFNLNTFLNIAFSAIVFFGILLILKEPILRETKDLFSTKN